MPTFKELIEAGAQLGEVYGPKCTPSQLFWLVDNAIRQPEDWGFPYSWRRAPNWDPSSVRTAIASSLWKKPTHPDRLPRAYYHLPFWALKTIADGNIESLWYEAPSSRTRHDWLVSCSVNRQYKQDDWRRWIHSPLRWVMRHFPLVFDPRTYAIADWLENKCGWAGWTRPLPIGYVAGQMVTIQPREILDEIWDEDLTSGRNSSPERVLRTVLARTSSGKLEEMRRNHTPFPPFPWKLVEGIRYLDTPAALIEEGEKMGHCVGTYVNACRTGKCYILALPNSTAEISPDGRVYQHKGMGNSSPPQKDHNLLMFWLQRRLTC